MIIGRTASKVFSTLEGICGSKSMARELFSLFDYLSLPLSSMEYCNDGETKVRPKYFDEFQYRSSKDVKRDLSKAFDKRKSVKVGDSFEFEGGYVHTQWGCIKQDVSVKRLSDKAVLVRIGLQSGGAYIVSSSKKELVKYQQIGAKPVLYRTVIF